MPGCGKSTIGRAVSKKLGIKFLDADDYIVKKTAKTIDEIFLEVGNEGFRKLESDCLVEISKMQTGYLSDAFADFPTELIGIETIKLLDK